MKTVEDSTFENGKQHLDGIAWKNCTFEGCEIIIETFEFGAVGCNFNNCHLTLEGRAAAIVKFVDDFRKSSRAKLSWG